MFGFVLGKVFSGELKMTDSRTLLAEYAQHGAEEAFSRLVSRYIDTVY